MNNCIHGNEPDTCVSCLLAERNALRNRVTALERHSRGKHRAKGVDVLLEAMAAHGGDFDVERMAVVAWQADAKSLGMLQFDYPCTRRIACMLHGSQGLIKKGLIERVSPGVYRLATT